MRDAFIKWLVSFLCGSVVSAAGIFATYRKKQKAIELGLQSLLRAEIIRQYEKYKERGYCPIYAREALTRAYDSYHALGGNDVATGLFNEVKELPTDPPGEQERKED